MLVMSVTADLFSAHCANTNRRVIFAEATFRANMAIDVATDILSLISLSKGNGFFLLIIFASHPYSGQHALEGQAQHS